VGLRATVPSGTGLLAGCALVAIAIGLLGYQVWAVTGDAKARAQLRKQIADTGGSELMPATPGELRRFLLLGILGGGVCEEIVFRGYLLSYFEELISLPVAVVLSSLIFGLWHAYQGVAGSVRTGVLGLVFAGITLLAGTFWPAVVLHAAVDIHAGLLGRATWGAEDAA
jgi:membrane protease YdiL (CAAX protease family)